MTTIETQEQRQKRKDREEMGDREAEKTEKIGTIASIIALIVGLAIIIVSDLDQGELIGIIAMVGLFALIMAHEVTTKNKKINRLQRENIKLFRETQELKEKHN